MVNVLTSVMIMMFPPVVLVMFPEDHLLAAGGMLGHVDVRVTEVSVVVTPGGLVSLRMMERTFLVFYRVSRGARCCGCIAVAVWTVEMVLLCQLS